MSRFTRVALTCIWYCLPLLVLMDWALPAGAQSRPDTALRAQIRQYVAQQEKVRWISQTVISPDGQSVAWAADGEPGNHTHAIYRAPIASPAKAVRITAAPPGAWAYETEPQWSPDGQSLAFLSDVRGEQNQVYVVSTANPATKARLLTAFDGYVSHLRWSPDGRYLSVLYVEKASREPSPMAATNRRVGVIDSLVNTDVQRVAIVDRQTGKTTLVSPVGLYIFEYDWSPDSQQLAYSAARPPGDANWYMARLYKQPIATMDTALVYKPTWQMALPRWSPDGQQIALVEGLMSDQGGTGGELFTVSVAGDAHPTNLTPGRKSSPSWFTWRPDGSILFTEFVGGSTAIATINVATRQTERLATFDEVIGATAEVSSVSVSTKKGPPVLAFIRSSFGALPEVWAGPVQSTKRLTELNGRVGLPLPTFTNVTWTSDSLSIQGWLLLPANYDPTKRYPMLVMVHGGPAWIATPTWSGPDFNTTLFTQFGYFVFFPNARGSHGQGEAFTRANRRDWGFGDLRDILRGVDAVSARYPIDPNRLGMLGWSYGGFMSMFAPTQTDRFRAVVAGAGAADWLSYYGQNAIDGWMLSYFGKSAYEEPAAYARVSPMTYIRKTKTPALILVGERDGEAPAPQSFQYWHALKDLGVPTQLVVYPDEGHSFEKTEHRVDVTFRTLEWFNKYLK